MIIEKGKRVKHNNSPQCTVYEYLHNDTDIDVAVAEISGRYPEEGFAVNEKVKEIVYIVSGRGKIVLDGSVKDISAGDSALINSNQKYFFEGNLELIISCNPAWYPAQYKTVK